MQALWMVAASFLFAAMAVGIKFAAHSFSTPEIVCYRGLVSMVLMTLLVRFRGVSLKTPVPTMHLTRSLVGAVSMSGWFYGIAHLPLATSMTLNYMSSVWMAAFILGGALFFRRAQLPGALLLTVLLGFVGVVLTLRPTIEQGQIVAGVIGLLSGMGSALAYMQVTALGKVGEPEERTVFYFSIGTAVVGAIGMLLTPTTPWANVRLQDAAWIVPIGVLASLGQWCMTRAYAKGGTLVVASMQYSGIVFASIFSLTLFGDRIEPLAWLGMAIIVTSGVMATVLRGRTLTATPVLKEPPP